MKIIKPGNIDRVKNRLLIFRCGACGCEFEAESTEYVLADEYEQLHDDVQASCYCPCCKKKVFKYFHDK